MLRSLSLARRLAPLARSFAKESTGIVGLHVEPEGVALLAALSSKLLRQAAEQLPATAQYRRTVETVYSARLAACEAPGATVESVEAAVGLGQIEELIRVARDELRLLPKMAGASPRLPLEPARVLRLGVGFVSAGDALAPALAVGSAAAEA